MACPACKIDYELLEKRIETGEIRNDDHLLQEVEKDVFIKGNLVIYCPSCREKIDRLNARIASLLRKQTLAIISYLLDRAHEERKSKK